MAGPVKKRLGELLVEAEVIDEHQLRAALGHQRQWGGKLGQALIDLKLATEPQIVNALSRKLGYEIVQLDPLQRTAALDAALKLVPRDVARRSNVVPLSADLSSVTVAMSDPTNLAVTDEISFRTGRRVKIVLAGDKEVARAVRRFYFPEEEAEAGALEIEPGGSSQLNKSYEALPDHMQQHYFQTQLREAAPAEPPAPAATPAPTWPAIPSARASAPAAPRPPSPPPTSPPRDPSREAALRDAVERMVAGEEAPGGLRAGRLAAAVARALIRRGLLSEADLLAELTPPRK
jgi:hypothetical protein